jgi:hypothetical protein
MWGRYLQDPHCLACFLLTNFMHFNHLKTAESMGPENEYLNLKKNYFMCLKNFKLINLSDKMKLHKQHMFLKFIASVRGDHDEFCPGCQRT